MSLELTIHPPNPPPRLTYQLMVTFFWTLSSSSKLYTRFSNAFLINRNPNILRTKNQAITRSGGGLPEDGPVSVDDLKRIPQVCFRCPLSPGHGQLRIRLPLLYPEHPLVATVEGTPQLSAVTREAITAAARDEAQRLSGEARREPHCLQVLGEALRVSAENPVTSSVIGCPSTRSSSAKGSSGDSTESKSRGHLRVNPGIHTPSDKRNQDPSCTGGGGWHDNSAVLLGRRLIYSHHIIAPQKRTGIIQAARELKLGGFSKV